MKRILVTGGAGFIGSAVVRHIINETADSVVVVSISSTALNWIECLRTISLTW